MTIGKLFASAALVLPGPAAAQKAVIVNAGSEQAIRVGDTTVSRPFGGELVDTLRIVGEYRLPGEQLWLVEGGRDAACPHRYVIVSRRSKEEIVATDPFGTCGTAARAAVSRGELVVPVAGLSTETPATRFAYRAGRLRQVDAAPGAMIAAAPVPAGCRAAAAVSPDEQAQVVEGFRRDFPRGYDSLSAIRKMEMDPASLRTLVTGLACLSTWPSANQLVLERSTKLFASPRWGKPAFAALDTVSRDPTSDLNVIAAVRSFSAEMSYRVAAREPAI